MNPLIRISRNSARLLSCAVVLLAVASGAVAQSFNIDLDVFFGEPSNGNGAPSSSFGGAADQIGLWNRVYCLDPGPTLLVDTAGQQTGVVISATNTGSGGGSNLPINTGDYALLLNDYARIPNSMTYRLSGLAPGSYQVYTYAVNSSGSTMPNRVTVFVPGSVQGAEVVTGPMPGNSFVYLVTHSVHDVLNVNGDLIIELDASWPNGYVNGFQIVSAPEPATITILFLAVAGLLRKKEA